MAVTEMVRPRGWLFHLFFFLHAFQSCTLTLDQAIFHSCMEFIYKGTSQGPASLYKLDHTILFLESWAYASKLLISFSSPGINCQSMNLLFALYLFFFFKEVYINLWIIHSDFSFSPILYSFFIFLRAVPSELFFMFPKIWGTVSQS